MNSHKVRQTFIDYFGRHGHRHEPSSRLIPENDPTLLFTNAGMNQFKNLFLGLEKRDYSRAVTAQKCVRAGGKHNDLENVGHTARHHTFFEMLGNFSFGDYFKKDAIHFAWELITQDLAIDKKRLYVTVFQDDDEAADIWHKQEGVPRDRIFRFGEKDNFWRMGDSGPCGPCSEIFYDLGPEVPGNPKENVMGGSGDRFMEFWNLVFMQYEEDGKGGRKTLPRPSVDTGMGLERMTTILQGKINNYETDVFQDLIGVAAGLAKTTYKPGAAQHEAINVALRVLADHARASAFLLADGVLPSNEGRGYVLRRIMRRAIRYGRQLSEEQSLLPAVVAAVIGKMGSVYRELEQQRGLIERTVHDEEKRFLATLDQGTHVLGQELQRLPTGGTLSGDTLFKLYDTFGFPVDLTQLMASEKGFRVDLTGFERLLGQAKQKAKASWKGKGLSADESFLVSFTQDLRTKSGETAFTGYGSLDESGAKLLGIATGGKSVADLTTDQTGFVVVDRTSFYAESGGQVGDRGIIRGPAGEAEVLDTHKINGVYLHHVKVTDGHLRVGEPIQLQVNRTERMSTASNHSATHLLHASLKKVLGEHVQQAGSLVDSERLRFDFTHNRPLSPAEAEQIEALVNAEIAKSEPVACEEMSQKDAMAKGAVALFGEKYGDLVRVVGMGNFSLELCGGTHVQNTSQIRYFKIVSEGGVSAGVRRIEALTSTRAIDYLSQLAREALRARDVAGQTLNYQKYLEDPGPGLDAWVTKTLSEMRALEMKMQTLKGNSVDVDQLLSGAQSFAASGGATAKFVFADVAVDDRKVLSDLSDRLRDKIQSGIVIVLGHGGGSGSSHPLIVNVTRDLTSSWNAGKLLGEVASVLGGKGGGRPDFAQGAVPARDAAAVAQARTRAWDLVQGVK